PKAGVLAEEEAKVVAHNIIAEINGTEKISFNGKGYCFVETGDGKAAYAEGDFFAEPSASVIMQEPSEKFLLEKIEFEKKRLKEWF
ncbi:NAD(P)/FAD-dependent oxidoreductase, partial [Candidatus Micrarchaeota archaeon]|nr:NAD(P)/FAD-dependent oxidoreductase [Candidatus Micrarchaeota archaeon]